MQITIDDVRKAGYCTRGARRWFEAHELPFDTFLKHGIDAEEFVRKGDDLAQTVVDRKREREQAHG